MVEDTEVTEGHSHMPSTSPKEGLAWIGEVALIEEPNDIKKVVQSLEGGLNNNLTIQTSQGIKFLFT